MTSEKERVYTELHALRRRCFEQRKEIALLRKAVTGKENAALRTESARYKSALSHILHRLDNDDLTDDILRRIVVRALELRGLRPSKRARIAKAHADDEEWPGPRCGMSPVRRNDEHETENEG